MKTYVTLYLFVFVLLLVAGFERARRAVRGQSESKCGAVWEW